MASENKERAGMTKIKTDKKKSYLRDSILGKRQVLHQHIEPFVLLIEKLSHPPKCKTKKHLIVFPYSVTQKKSFTVLFDEYVGSPDVISPKRYLQLSEHLS